MIRSGDAGRILRRLRPQPAREHDALAERLEPRHRHVLALEDDIGPVGPAVQRLQARLGVGLQGLSIAEVAYQNAVTYAKANGIPYQVFEPHVPTPKPKAYSDNFRYDRKVPWSH